MILEYFPKLSVVTAYPEYGGCRFCYILKKAIFLKRFLLKQVLILGVLLDGNLSLEMVLFDVNKYSLCLRECEHDNILLDNTYSGGSILPRNMKLFREAHCLTSCFS